MMLRRYALQACRLDDCLAKLKMGKVRNKKHRLHSAAAASVGRSSDKTESQLSVDTEPFASSNSAPHPSIFSKLDIDINALQRHLPGKDGDDFDVRSAVTSRYLKGMNLKKKTKRELKKEFWSKKMHAIKAVRQEAKDRKQREKTAIVGDMKPLSDTLPTLELLMKESFKPKTALNKMPEKPRSIKKEKKRKKEMLEDMNVFKAVLSHPAYKADPQGTISEHLRNKLKQEEEMDT